MVLKLKFKKFSLFNEYLPIISVVILFKLKLDLNDEFVILTLSIFLIKKEFSNGSLNLNSAFKIFPLDLRLYSLILYVLSKIILKLFCKLASKTLRSFEYFKFFIKFKYFFNL